MFQLIILLIFQASHPVHVIFVSTEEGEIKKLSYNPQTRETCLLEVLHPFPENDRKVIRTMKILTSMNSVYLATDDSILRLPVQRCSRFITRKARNIIITNLSQIF